MSEVTTPKLLFSEDQVNELVEARQGRWLAERRLEDAAPSALSINIRSAITKLKDMEGEVIDKHKQAIVAWKKSYKLYAEAIGKNPGSQTIQKPGEQPKLPAGIEHIRAYVRAFSTLTVDKIKIPKTEWISIFKDASQAIADARALRDSHVAYISGAASISYPSNTLTTTYRQ